MGLHFMKKNYPKYVGRNSQTKTNKNNGHKKVKKSLKQVRDLLKRTKLSYYYKKDPKEFITIEMFGNHNWITFYISLNEHGNFQVKQYFSLLFNYYVLDVYYPSSKISGKAEFDKTDDKRLQNLTAKIIVDELVKFENDCDAGRIHNNKSAFTFS